MKYTPRSVFLNSMRLLRPMAMASDTMLTRTVATPAMRKVNQ
jgi:hypothetical protein